MALEIERKFLVTGDFKSAATRHCHIQQGYLSTVAQRTVRVRIQDSKAYLTIKGIGNTSGMSRYEWEKEITVADAQELIALCEPGIIDKVRYCIPSQEHLIEVDEFAGENTGLILAEIELCSEDEVFVAPSWLGKEVTGDARYYNAALVKNPYTSWKNKSFK